MERASKTIHIFVPFASFPDEIEHFIGEIHQIVAFERQIKLMNARNIIPKNIKF